MNEFMSIGGVEGRRRDGGREGGREEASKRTE